MNTFVTKRISLDLWNTLLNIMHNDRSIEWSRLSKTLCYCNSLISHYIKETYLTKNYHFVTTYNRNCLSKNGYIQYENKYCKFKCLFYSY